MDLKDVMNFSFADYVVLAAGLTFCLGYAVINQVALRLLILFGTGLYIWYYAISADTPQWAAIWTSIAMGLANIFGLTTLWLRNSTLSIPRRHKDIYAHFDILPPGDFRKLMRAAKRQTLPAGFALTRRHIRVKTVYFILNGTVTVQKFGETFFLPEGIFLGEVAYLTNNRASATSILTEESDVLAWDVADLKRFSAKDVRFKLALDALISMDLAEKVARAGSPRYEEQFHPEENFEKDVSFFHNPGRELLNLPAPAGT